MNIYFIQIGKKRGPIKIGVARDVEKRLAELQLANPYDLHILAVLPCKSEKHAYNVENQLHRKFKYARIRGEWFEARVKDRIPEILATIF